MAVNVRLVWAQVSVPPRLWVSVTVTAAPIVAVPLAVVVQIPTVQVAV